MNKHINMSNDVAKSILSLISQVLNENLNPIWNQTFDFVVEDALHEMLILEVWDHDTFGKVNTVCISSIIQRNLLYESKTVLKLLSVLFCSYLKITALIFLICIFVQSSNR